MVECVIFPPEEMGVPSITKRGTGMSFSIKGILYFEASVELTKLLVAPQSSIAVVVKVEVPNRR